MQNQFLPSELSPETVIDTTLAPSAGTLTAETMSTGELSATKAAQSLLTTQAVTDLLARTQQTLRRRKRWFWSSMLVCVGLDLLALYWVLTYDLDKMPGMMNCLYALTALGTVLNFWVGVAPIKFDANELARLGGKNAIPALLDYLTGNPSQPKREACIKALTILLPQLQATDAPLLTPLRKRYLNGLLKLNRLDSQGRGGGGRLVAPLLKAYEQVGDADAIPLVARLANRKPRSFHQLEIQKAAQECLPLLQARVGDIQTEQTLLRAASADTAAPNTLLRPAASTLPAPKDELLRAMESANEPPSA